MTEELNWREKLAQKFWAIKIGERAENLRQAAKRFDNVDSLTMATREKLLGKEITDNNRPEGEEMHIGDDNSVIHQYLPERKSGGLLKLAIATGLLATGIGVPAGAWMVADVLKNRPEPVLPDKTIDTNTEYDIELVE